MAAARKQNSPPQQEDLSAKKTKLGKRYQVKDLSTVRPVIVGIGASAGGLEALMTLFDHAPADIGGVSFVVVTHLDPHHNSMMPELLQKHTAMKVVQVQDEILVEPDTVYVIPPNKVMGIFGRRLQLLDRDDDQASRKPIDYFLRTLALDQQERSVGVILSGMDSDGTQGVISIKNELGLVIVQDPNTARFASMPQSAIDTGQADFVLLPEDIAPQIADYAHNLSRKKQFRITEKDDTPVVIRQVFMVLRSATGHDFSPYKRSTMLRRIERRLAATHLESIQQYVKYLSQNSQEANLLLNELLIGVTGFFRDPKAFNALESLALSRILDNKKDDSPIRIWVVGCSTGEEAYSIAILLKEHMNRVKREFDVQIFATDIDERGLAAARSGVYPSSALDGIGKRRLNQFFVKEDTSYRIKREIRDMIMFAMHNVLRNPPFTRLDLISCRNLLIYLRAEVQNSLLPLFHFGLKPGGILFLGSSETVGQQLNIFATIEKQWKLYSKINVPTPGRPLFESPLGRQSAQVREKMLRKEDAPDVEHTIEKLLLKHLRPASVIINEKGLISFIYGHTRKYLEAPHGTPRSNVFEMAREGLRTQLITAVRKASTEGVAVTVKGRVRDEKEFTAAVTVIPIRDSENLQGLFLVLFESLKEPQEVRVQKGESTKHDEYVQQLEKELQAAREDLQTAIEELETTNEELVSTNEEYMSTNEELQSTNEEVETSKEELQSLNEELVTVNNELQNKLDELSSIIADHRNSFDSLNVPTIFLDRALLIKRFTAGVEKLVNLIDSDIGRPIGHIATNLRDEELTSLCRSVLDTEQNIEKEVFSTDNHAYLMRVLPYRSIEKRVIGVVVTFFDIQEIRSLQNSLVASEAARKLADNIIATIDEPFLVLDRNMNIITTNSVFLHIFQQSRTEIINRNFFEISQGKWDIPSLRELLLKVLPTQNVFENYRVKYELPHLGELEFALKGRRVVGRGPEDELILVSFKIVKPKT